MMKFLQKNPSKSQYKAFISYKHQKQSRFAERVELALKNYAKPIWKPPIRVFRDEKHLRPGIDLPALLRSALLHSEYFIYLASPEAAASRWVQSELDLWCNELNRTNRLIIVLTDGVIGTDPSGGNIDWSTTNALPSTLKRIITKVPYYVDLSWVETDEQQSLLDPDFKKAINAITARLREVDPIELSGTEVIQHRRNIRLRNLLFSLIGCLACGLGIAAVLAWTQKTVADRNARQSLARQLAAQSQLELQNFPQRALLLAASSIEATRRVDGRIEPEATRAALEALAAVGGKRLLDGEPKNRVIAINEDASTIAVGDRITGNVHLISPFDDSFISAQLVSKIEEGVLGLAIAASGNSILASSRKGCVRLCRFDRSLKPNCLVIRKSGRPILSIMFSKNDLKAVFKDQEGNPEIWDLQTKSRIYPKTLFKPGERPLRAQHVTLSPDGTWLAYTTSQVPKNAKKRQSERMWPIRSDLIWLVHLPTGSVNKFDQALDSDSVEIRWLKFTPESKSLVIKLMRKIGNIGKPFIELIRLNTTIIKPVDIVKELGWRPTDVIISDGQIHILRHPKLGPPDVWAVQGMNGFVRIGDLADNMQFSDREMFSVSKSGCLLVDLLKSGRVRAFMNICDGNSNVPLELGRGFEADQGSQITFSSNERYVVMLPGGQGQDKSVYIWDLKTSNAEGRPRRFVLRGHESTVKKVLFANNNEKLVTISLLGEMRLWHLGLSSGAAIPSVFYEHPPSVIQELVVSQDKRWIAHSSVYGGLLLSDISTSGPPKHYHLKKERRLISGLTFVSNDSLLGVAEIVGKVNFWRTNNVAEGKLTIAGEWNSDDPINDLALSPDGKVAAVRNGRIKRKIQVLAVNTTRNKMAINEVCEIPDNTGKVAFAGTGGVFFTSQKLDERKNRLIAVFVSDGNCHISELDTSTYGGIQMVAISSDRKWLAYDSRTEQALLKVRRIYIDKGNEIRLGPAKILNSVNRQLTALTFSPNIKWIAAGDGDGNLLLWRFGQNGPYGAPLKSTRHNSLTPGTNSDIQEIDFDQSGRFMATRSGLRDNVLIWDLQQTAVAFEPVELSLLDNEIGTIEFGYTPGTLMVGRGTGGVEIWPIDPSIILDKACEIAGRTLNKVEVETFLRDHLASNPPCVAFN